MLNGNERVQTCVVFMIIAIGIFNESLILCMKQNSKEPQSTDSNASDDSLTAAESIGLQSNKVSGSYNFAYKVQDGKLNSHFRHEQRTDDGTVTGSYGYTDKNGIHQIVDYIADHNGYRAQVRHSTRSQALPPNPGRPNLQGRKNILIRPNIQEIPISPLPNGERGIVPIQRPGGIRGVIENPRGNQPVTGKLPTGFDGNFGRRLDPTPNLDGINPNRGGVLLPRPRGVIDRLPPQLPGTTLAGVNNGAVNSGLPRRPVEVSRQRPDFSSGRGVFQSQDVPLNQPLIPLTPREGDVITGRRVPLGNQGNVIGRPLGSSVLSSDRPIGSGTFLQRGSTNNYSPLAVDAEDVVQPGVSSDQEPGIENDPSRLPEPERIDLNAETAPGRTFDSLNVHDPQITG